MKICYALAATAALVAAPASAQEERAFGGLSAGLLAGWDHVTIDAEDLAEDLEIDIEDDDAEGSKNGVAFSALLGYDYDMRDAVVGVEAEIGESSTQVEENFGPDDRILLAADLDLYLGVRAGYKVTPTTLLYAKGGYTRTKFKLSVTSDGSVFEESDGLDGYRLGAGIEQAFGRIRVRAEYRYSDYGDYSYDGFETGLSARRHQVVVAAVGNF